MPEDGIVRLKAGLAEMLKGGVIMDVTDAPQAKAAEESGAVAVMALERVPAQIRAEGGVARMASPRKIREIMDAVSIPVMAKCRIGHFAEAQILEALGVDYIDESEVLTPADEEHHIDKHAFKVPFVCGARGHEGTQHLVFAGLVSWLVSTGFSIPGGCGTRAELQRALFRANVNLRVTVETYNYDLQLSLVARGRGLSLVPARILRRSRQRSRLCVLRIRGLEFPLTVWTIRSQSTAELDMVLGQLNRDLMWRLLGTPRTMQ